MTAGQELLTTEEVAQRLRTAVSTVRYWRHCGTGPVGVRLGRRVLYRASDVDAWLAGKFEEEWRSDAMPLTRAPR